jgi:hypothetical protein
VAEAKSPPPAAHLVHAVPGRLRLRIPARRGDAAFFRDVGESFDLCRHVLAAEGNARTASLLIRHEGEPETVWRFAETRGLFLRQDPAAAGAPRVLDRVVADARQIDTWFKSSSAGDLDLSTLVTAGLMGMSLLQLARGNFLAPSVTLAWYAATLVQGRVTAANPPSARHHPTVEQDDAEAHPS